MSSNYYDEINNKVKNECSRRIRERFDEFKKILNENIEIIAYCSKLDTEILILYIVNGKNFFIIDFSLGEYKIAIYNKSDIKKIEIINNESMLIKIFFNQDIYEISYSKMKYWFSNTDLEEWMYEFICAIKE